MPAKPTPMPPTSLAVMTNASDGASADPIAETRKSAAAIVREPLRPRRSLSHPAIPAPMTLPSRAELTVQPKSTGPSSNCRWRGPTVPEMTAVSNPNRKPPSAPLPQARAKRAPG